MRLVSAIDRAVSCLMDALGRDSSRYRRWLALDRAVCARLADKGFLCDEHAYLTTCGYVVLVSWRDDRIAAALGRLSASFRPKSRFNRSLAFEGAGRLSAFCAGDAAVAPNYGKLPCFLPGGWYECDAARAFSDATWRCSSLEELELRLRTCGYLED